MTDRFSFICTKCWNVDDATVKIDFKNKDIGKHYFKELIVNYTCPKCKILTHHIYTDRKIAKSVALMNRLGYVTNNSCEGHFKFKYDHHKLGIAGGTTCPYISFSCKKNFLTEELAKDILKAGFNVFMVKDKARNISGLGEFQDNKKIKMFPYPDEDEIFYIINNYTEISFYYNWDAFVKDNPDLTPKEAEVKARRFLNKLYRRLENYLTKHIDNKEKTNDQTIQTI